MAQQRRRSRRSAQREQPLEVRSEPGAARTRRPPSGPRSIPKGYLILAGVFAVALVTALIVNYYYSVKKPNDTPVLQVNNRIFTWADFVSILKSQKLGADAFGTQFNSGIAPYQLMQTLTENALIKEAAVREGLHVDDQALKQEEVSRLVPDAQPSSDKAQVERDFQVALSHYLTLTQLSKSQYDDIVRADLLRNQLRDKLGANIPRVQPQARLNVIKVAGPEDAQSVADRLKKGEDFSRVARQVSVDDATRDAGGDAGWVPRHAYPEFDDQLFGLDTNQVSEPFAASDGNIYVIKISERVGNKAHVLAIVTKDGTTARDAKTRVENGALFQDVAAQVSTDADIRTKRGDLGLVGVGDLGGKFDLAIQGTLLNKVSDPLSSTDGTIFIMVTERSSAIEVSDKNLDKLKSAVLEQWIRREWDASKVDYCPNHDDCFSNIKVDKALKGIGDISKTKFEQAVTATAVARKKASQPVNPLAAPN